MLIIKCQLYMWNDKRLGNADSAEIIKLKKKRRVHFFSRMIRDPPGTTNHLIFASTNPQIASWTLRPRAAVGGVSGRARGFLMYCGKMCVCAKKPQRPGAGKYYKPERVRDSTEREREGGERSPAAVSSGISMPWASFLRGTEPDRLSQKCLNP